MPAPYMFKKTSMFIENANMELFYIDRQIIGTEILGKSVAEEQSSRRFIARFNNLTSEYDWTYVSVAPDLTVTLISDGSGEDLSSFTDFLEELPENMRITNLDFGTYTELKDVWNP